MCSNKKSRTVERMRLMVRDFLREVLSNMQHARIAVVLAVRALLVLHILEIHEGGVVLVVVGGDAVGAGPLTRPLTASADRAPHLQRQFFEDGSVAGFYVQQ